MEDALQSHVSLGALRDAITVQVCVCVRERERERERGRECVRERGSMCACVFVGEIETVVVCE